MKYQLVNENFKESYVNSLLKARGVNNIYNFLNPTEDCLNSYEDLDNIKEAAILLVSKLKEGNKILIIVDSDVDGFTSAAITYLYLQKVAPMVEIEYWLHEGKQHGLEDHIEKLLDQNDYDLLITPDASSNDYKYHEMLKNIDLPVLVLDHHLVDEQISNNAVIINNQTSPSYKNKDLTGAGVVFQFCRYLDWVFGVDYAKNFIDLAALGIVADMASMLSLENRYIIKTGFNRIRNFFFNVLVEKQSFSMGGKVTPITVAFYVVPLINAMIRVGSIEEKTRLFEAFIDGEKTVLSNKRGAKGEPEFLAVESARECTNAKTKQNNLKEKITEILESKIYKKGLLDNEILFIKLDEEDDIFPQELTGLIAMQLSARFKKPTIVARVTDDGHVKGSMRGVNGSELESFKDFLEDSTFFEYVSGHDNAAGISIYEESLFNFHKYANEKLKDIDFGQNYHEINFSRYAVDEDLYSLVLEIGLADELWGQNNSTPKILVKGINLNQNEYQIIGKNKDTVKFTKNGVDYIHFRAKDMIEKLEEFENLTLEIIGEAKINEWGGRTKPQVIIKDYSINDGNLSF